MVFAHRMDNDQPPVVTATLLVPLQNSSCAEAAEALLPHGLMGLHEEHSWMSNRTELQYELNPGEVATASIFFGALWLFSIFGNSLVCLLSICIDRFYTIVYPLSFKVSREKAKKMIAASWILDAAFVTPVFFFYGSNWDSHCNYFLPPSWEGTAYTVIHFLVGFVIPSILIILFYQKVIKYIWRIGTDGRTLRRTMNIVPRTKVKTVKMFLLLNLVFLFSWLPFHVAQLWHPHEQDYKKSSLVFTAVTWVSFSSSASKPTLYSIYNANFRRGMKETFCMSSMKCYRSNAYTITTSSRMAKRNYVGISEIPPVSRTITKDSIYDSFDREAREKKLAWPINSNPPNTFV